MAKKIYKFPTGAEIPEGAIYLHTVTQTRLEKVIKVGHTTYRKWEHCWFVWHYFLVEVTLTTEMTDLLQDPDGNESK